MSQENVEIVQRFYRAWARNDLPGPVDPEIEYVNPIRAVEPGTRRGLTAFSRAVEKVFDGLETWQIEPERLTLRGRSRRGGDSLPRLTAGSGPTTIVADTEPSAASHPQPG